MMQTCTKCYEAKPEREFYAGRRRCMVCMRAEAKAYYWRNHERCKEASLMRHHRLRTADAALRAW